MAILLVPLSPPPRDARRLKSSETLQALPALLFCLKKHPCQRAALSIIDSNCLRRNKHWTLADNYCQTCGLLESQPPTECYCSRCNPTP